MGNICTRSCRFCSVSSGKPLPLDPLEPARVAKLAYELKLKHVVVTSVTRDDLEDGGADFFVETIHEIRRLLPEAMIEVLTPDFGGKTDAVLKVCMAHPNIFNHNIETVRRLTATVRNKASYDRSLSVIKTAKKFMFLNSEKMGKKKGAYLVKSGFMLGLGETEKEVIMTIKDLKEAGCDIITIGQYLRPTKDSLPVISYIEPHKFEKYKKIGEEIGVKYMFCGPFIRSSYIAGDI